MAAGLHVLPMKLLAIQINGSAFFHFVFFTVTTLSAVMDRL